MIAADVNRRRGFDLTRLTWWMAHFVPNITIGPPVVRSIAESGQRSARRALDDQRPDRWRIDAFACGRSGGRFGARRCCQHLASHHPRHPGARRTRPRAVLNPSTPVVAIQEVAGDVDYALVMSVNPGLAARLLSQRSESKFMTSARCSIRAVAAAQRSKSTAASTRRTSRRWVGAWRAG